ncbi:hypothetical protein GCM10009672_01990 [Nesterenkonia lutea]
MSCSCAEAAVASCGTSAAFAAESVVERAGVVVDPGAVRLGPQQEPATGSDSAVLILLTSWAVDCLEATHQVRWVVADGAL